MSEYIHYTYLTGQGKKIFIYFILLFLFWKIKNFPAARSSAVLPTVPTVLYSYIKYISRRVSDPYDSRTYYNTVPTS